LGNTPFAREAAYFELVQSGISTVQQNALTDSALSGWALGDADFVADLQKKTERRVVKAIAGRPVSKPKNL
jgi:putative transposase